MKVVIIGGVAGGATAAARLRRLNEAAEIIIIERSGYISYANCGLPYYIGGVIEDKEALTLQTPESFRQRFRVDVRVKQEALAIDPQAKTVTIKRLEDNTEYTETYDKLLLSPGAKALHPNIPGSDSKNIMTLRTVEDTYRIKEYLAQNQPKHCTVIGGGFIGLEAAENLLQAGVATTLLQLDVYKRQSSCSLATAAPIARLGARPAAIFRESLISRPLFKSIDIAELKLALATARLIFLNTVWPRF